MVKMHIRDKKGSCPIDVWAPHTGPSMHSTVMPDYWSCLTQVAQAQQQAMYQQATLGLPHTGRSSTATGYVATGLELPHTGRSSAATGLCTNRLLWTASHGSLKHNNGLSAPPTDKLQQTALSPRSLKRQRAVCQPGYQATSRTMRVSSRLADNQTMCQQTVGSPGSAQVTKTESNGLCTSRLPWAARSAQAQQQAVYQQSCLGLPHRSSSSTTKQVPIL
jgi:hypothetical protein